jgi:putative membrane protein
MTTALAIGIATTGAMMIGAKSSCESPRQPAKPAGAIPAARSRSSRALPRWLGLALAGSLASPVAAFAEQRSSDASWGTEPLWGPLAALGVGLVLLVALGWALLNVAPLVLAIVAAVLGIRWLIGATRDPRPDAAVSILRERYARGDITREEFEAKLRDLGGAR